jgi:hypothetical protein
MEEWERNGWSERDEIRSGKGMEELDRNGAVGEEWRSGRRM